VTVRRIAVSELVEDFDLYPRTAVSSTHVRDIAEAMQAGFTMPPIVADDLTKRVVDGYHRRRAYLRVFGENHLVDVDLRHYGSELELFLEAVEANSYHGTNLNEYENRRVVLRLKDANVADADIARVLHVTPVRVQKLVVQTATVTLPGGQVRFEPLKRPLFHFQGQAMTAGQAKAQRSAPGTSYTLVIAQLRDAVTWDLLDRSHAKTIADLRNLYQLIGNYLNALGGGGSGGGGSGVPVGGGPSGPPQQQEEDDTTESA
jgi:hypothetical protein